MNKHTRLVLLSVLWLLFLTMTAGQSSVAADSAKGAGVQNPETLFARGKKHHLGKGAAKDYKAAYSYYTQAAALGHAVAMNNLGVMYQHGQGVKKDIKQAYRFFRKAEALGFEKAAENAEALYALGIDADNRDAATWFTREAQRGDETAQYILGRMYETGEHIPPDFSQAIEWYTKAAEKNSLPACVALGDMYRDGRGIDQNVHKAVQLYTKAADKNLLQAIANLGALLTLPGPDQNYTKAEKLLREAMVRGDRQSATELALVYIGERIPNVPSSEGVNILNRETKRKNPNAQYALSLLYSQGIIVAIDQKKATELLVASAKAGYAPAQTDLGNAYFNGVGFRQSFTDAITWYEKAASNGNTEAMRKLGTMYYLGTLGKPDYVQAAKWYAQGAERNDKDSLKFLAEMLITGVGAQKDKELAARVLVRAAEKGDLEAQVLLGEMCQNGTGVQQDTQEAEKWFAKAANRGSSEGQFLLARLYASEHKYEDAKIWLDKAMTNYHAEAAYVLALWYEKGDKIPADPARSAECYKTAAERGIPEAEFAYAKMLDTGTPYVRLNRADAKYYYELAGEHGYVEAQYTLGMTYLRERKAPEFALLWLRKAADQGHVDAMYESGMAYYDSGDFVKAMEQFMRAEDSGHAMAQRMIKVIEQEHMHDHEIRRLLANRPVYKFYAMPTTIIRVF